MTCGQQDCPQEEVFSYKMYVEIEGLDIYFTKTKLSMTSHYLESLSVVKREKHLFVYCFHPEERAIYVSGHLHL